jgi:hypothetical protein
VSKVTEKIKTRSKPTPSENFNSHPLYLVVEEFTQSGSLTKIFIITTLANDKRNMIIRNFIFEENNFQILVKM